MDFANSEIHETKHWFKEVHLLIKVVFFTVKKSSEQQKVANLLDAAYFDQKPYSATKKAHSYVDLLVIAIRSLRVQTIADIYETFMVVNDILLKNASSVH